MHHTESVAYHSGTIRHGTLFDTHELSRLVACPPASPANRRGPSRADMLDMLSRGHLLVLELNKHTLGAAIHVNVFANRATVDLLVIDPALQGQHVAERMSGVAHALCEAYGYTVSGPALGIFHPVGSRG